MNNLKRDIRKVLCWEPGNKLMAVLAALVLLALLLPIIRITRYCIPWYDDYNYGNFVKKFLEQEYSLRSVFQGVSYCIKNQWWAWQGTFSSIFFMVLVPNVWNEDWYFLGPLFLVLICTVSVLVLTKVLLRDVLNADRNSSIILQVFAAVLVIELMHTSRSGFFWYNSGIHYVGMHSFFFLFLAVMIELLIRKGKVAASILTVLSIIGGVIVSGANFVTALQGMLVSLLMLGIGILLKKKRVFLLLPSIFVYAFGFYMNVSAPGNSKRGAYFTGLGPVQSIAQSFVEAFRYLWKFSGWMTILILILIVPIIWRMVGNLSFRFPLPGVVLALSFCLYATGFTPSLYSMGDAGLGRTLNAVKMTFQILLLINEVYWIGWLRKKLEASGKKIWQGKCYWWVYVLVMAMMFVVFKCTPSPEGIYTSWGAYYFVHTGESYNYYQQYLDRVILIQNSGSDVIVRPYVWNPWLIRIGDLSEDPNAEQNQAMAAWYNKKSISCIPEETVESEDSNE